MKKKMYDSIPMTSKSGEFLNWISFKKKQWYLSKNLAYSLPTGGIQLKFTSKSPSLPLPSNSVEKNIKSNHCVRCGDANNGYMRHYIIPSSLRTLLPKKFKSHLSHDVVLICPTCFQLIQSETSKRLTSLEKKFSKGLTKVQKKKYVVDWKIKEIKTCGNALLKYSDKLPDEVRVKHESIVREYFGGDFGEKDLKGLMDLEENIINLEYINPHELIIKSLKSEIEIRDFVRGWRRYFIEEFNPQNMPKGWKIEGRVSNNGIVEGEEESISARLDDEVETRNRTVTEVYEERVNDKRNRRVTEFYVEEVEEERGRSMTEVLEDLGRIRKGIRENEEEEGKEEVKEEVKEEAEEKEGERRRSVTIEAIEDLVELRRGIREVEGKEEETLSEEEDEEDEEDETTDESTEDTKETTTTTEEKPSEEASPGRRRSITLETVDTLVSLQQQLIELNALNFTSSSEPTATQSPGELPSPSPPPITVNKSEPESEPESSPKTSPQNIKKSHLPPRPNSSTPQIPTTTHTPTPPKFPPRRASPHPRGRDCVHPHFKRLSPRSSISPVNTPSPSATPSNSSFNSREPKVFSPVHTGISKILISPSIPLSPDISLEDLVNDGLKVPKVGGGMIIGGEGGEDVGVDGYE